MSLPLVILLVLIVYGMLLSLVVILERRNPTSGLAWIAALIFLPGAGLVLYWLVNNVLSIAQQLYINKQSLDSGGGEWTQSKSKQKPSQKQ